MKHLVTCYRDPEAWNSLCSREGIVDSPSLLIQAFCGDPDPLKLDVLRKDLARYFPQAVILGTSTDGGICGSEVILDQNVLSFTLFEKTSLRSHLIEEIEEFETAGRAVAQSLIDNETRVIIAFIDGLEGDGDAFVQGIASVDEAVHVAGGLSGDSARFEGTYVFDRNRVVRGGAVAVALSSPSLTVTNRYSFNWNPIGRRLRITSAEGNVVHTIDDRPAREIYAYYLGEEVARRLPETGIEFPLIMEREGQTIARAVINTLQDGSLVFAGKFREGDEVQFGYGNAELILDAAPELALDLARQPVEAIYIYSCMARRRFMPDTIGKEIEPFAMLAPTAGFFTYGEFYGQHLLNETMTILALGEGGDALPPTRSLPKELSRRDQPLRWTFRAFSHLIDVSTRELNRQKEEFRTIFEQSKGAIAIIDPAEGRFLQVNPAYCEMTGYSREELLGLHCSDLTRAEYLEASRQAISKVLERGHLKNYTKECRRKDGEFITVTLSMSLLEDPRRILINVQDVTQWLRNQQALEAAKRKAEEATRLKSAFLANMSHEIRTPMNGIMGMAHLLTQSELNPSQKEYVQIIENSAKNLLEIINDILDFSKVEAGKLKLEEVEFDLFETVEEVLAVSEPRIREKGLELTVHYDLELGKRFLGDRLRIAQVLTNLLSNAVKFTERGEIALDIERRGANRVRFEVHDTGIGMSPEVLARLFRPFTQADVSTTRRYGGTGLGLSISKQLVEMMGGKIEVESTPGEGSTFRFELPLQELDPQDRHYNLFSGRHVMLVEGNEAWREILGEILRSFDLTVAYAYSAQDALEKVGQCREDLFYDLILMDQNLPDIDGFLLLEKFRGLCPDDSLLPPIIMLSSDRQVLLSPKVHESGAEYCLHKPVNPSILNNVLSDLFLGTDMMGEQAHLGARERRLGKFRHLKGRILLVEDNQTNQIIIKNLLNAYPELRLEIALHGREAVTMVHRHPGRYDLILMDIQMPVMDGYEATRRIRLEDPSVPIVALTANALRENIEMTRRSGMNDHLNKPIDVEKFYAVIHRYLGTMENGETLSPGGRGLPEDESIPLPHFQSIDTAKGLPHFGGNRRLYRKILEQFLKNYRTVDWENLSTEEIERTAHTLKGLSANIGAMTLNRYAEDLEKVPADHQIRRRVDQELKAVLEELEQGLQSVEKSEKETTDSEKCDSIAQDDSPRRKPKILPGRKKELFTLLSRYAARRRSRQCRQILQEFQEYRLNSRDSELIDRLVRLVEQRDYDEIVKLVESAFKSSAQSNEQREG
ncbi:FIST N-terminal domain-containing protein [Nitratifractor sp.]|uniref:response regulator n=1 Tax=Nitratifractor sp. TaxID=2268144 RepID=UPI0025E41D51|nr:FIST N-terminal domain-containing protein [Nitratifractor sp.]